MTTRKRASHPRSSAQFPAQHPPSGDLNNGVLGDALSDALSDDTRFGLSLDGLAMVAGPSRAVIHNPGGRPSIVDLATLDPRSWIS